MLASTRTTRGPPLKSLRLDCQTDADSQPSDLFPACRRRIAFKQSCKYHVALSLSYLHIVGVRVLDEAIRADINEVIRPVVVDCEAMQGDHLLPRIEVLHVIRNKMIKNKEELAGEILRLRIRSKNLREILLKMLDISFRNDSIGGCS